MKETVLRTIKPFLPAASRLGSTLLRSSGTRRLLNHGYEKLGPEFRWYVNWLFDDSKIRREFLWKCAFLDKNFVLPVYPELQRSWNTARVWRWVGNRIIRRFYEFYIRSHAPGVLLDVGANDGTHCYPFAAHDWQCICFEPQPSCTAYIRRVVGQNGFKRMTVVEGVLGVEEVAEVEFFVSDHTWYSSLIQSNVERFEASHAVRVKSTSMDTYCAENRLQPTLVKIDVEGAEWIVVDGGRNTFSAAKPDIFIEISSDQAIKERIWDFFKPLGYRFYFLKDTTRAFHPVLSISDFVAVARDDVNGDFILLADAQFANQFEHALCSG